MFRKILLSVDIEDDDNARPIAAADKMARAFDAELHVLAVLPTFGMSIVGSYFEDGYEAKALKEVGDRLTALVNRDFPQDIEVHPHVVHGKIYQEIISAANTLGCDAIIIGSHRPELSDYLLGPNAARVVRHARQSVFVVRQ